MKAGSVFIATRVSCGGYSVLGRAPFIVSLLLRCTKHAIFILLILTTVSKWERASAGRENIRRHRRRTHVVSFAYCLRSGAANKVAHYEYFASIQFMNVHDILTRENKGVNEKIQKISASPPFVTGENKSTYNLIITSSRRGNLAPDQAIRRNNIHLILSH